MMEVITVKIIDKPVKRKIVLYNPNNQNTGIAIIIDIKAGIKLKSLNKINSSNLNTKASQVHRMHKPASEIIAMNCFEKRGKDKIFFENSFI